MAMTEHTDVYRFAVDPDGHGARLDYTDTHTRHPGTIHVSAAQMHALVDEMDNQAQENK